MNDLKLVYTLLCDDVRIEMGNKISLMGIFQNIMVEKLPKLGSGKVDHCNFTGSVAGGRAIEKAAAGTFMTLGLELGGKDPAYVLPDAKLDHAIANLVDGAFYNSGQCCCGIERIYVHEKVYDNFVADFTGIAAGLKIGDGLDPATNMGPLANPRRVNAMEAFVADAEEKGAQVATGGSRVGNEGNFFQPTVLTDIPENARVLSEEPFGPLALMLRFKDTDEVLSRANALPFGLASYAFTRNGNTATKVADALESGMVTINHFGIALPETPFGGIKDSGFGHEGGIEGLNVYMQTKFVSHIG